MRLLLVQLVKLVRLLAALGDHKRKGMGKTSPGLFSNFREDKPRI